jgi:hypothetical protein
MGSRREAEGRRQKAEGLSYWLNSAKLRKTALSRGERVVRCRRFHEPERAG